MSYLSRKKQKMLKKFNNILIIDDDQVNNFIVSSTLKKLQISEHIDAVLNGLEGIHYLIDKSKSAPEMIPQLIILDINMSVMDGWEFLEEFEKFEEEFKSNINIYMVSSSVYEEDIQRSKTFASVKDFISKPLLEETILQIYNKHFNE